MADDIVKQLRALAEFDNSPYWELRAAADAIETRAAEIERLRAEHTTVERLVAGQLSARLLEVEAERDAERALADRLAVALEAETADPERTLLHADSMQALKAYDEARRG